MQYISKSMYEKAKEANKKQDQIDIQEKNNMYVTFGNIGLTVFKLGKNLYQSKHLNYWNDYTLKDINDKLNVADWTNE